MLDPFVVSPDMNTNNRMRNIARQHSNAKPVFTNKIRAIQWRNYFTLQIIRLKLSHFPAGMITLIPASRWLFDNFHLLYRNFKSTQAGGDVAKFSHMPVIRRGPEKGYPCIYLIAREMISCSNQHLTEESVMSMLKEYQEVKILSSAELALIPDMIVFCLLEKIIDEGKKIIPVIKNKAKADKIMRKIAPYFIKGDNNAFAILKSNVKIKDMMEHTFCSHLIYRLRSFSLNQQDIIDFLSDVLKNGKDGNELITEITENERLFEAASENKISSLITSLSEVSGIDNDEFVSCTSSIEAALVKDPEDIYHKMNSTTRARYRESVVKFAKKYKFDEITVARSAIKLSNTPPEGENFPYPHHVGTYLVSDGIPYLESTLSGKTLKARDFSSIIKTMVRSLYFIGIAVITLGIIPVIGLILKTDFYNLQPALVVFYISLILPASGMAVFVMNSIFTRAVHPVAPLSMNFESGIPDDCQTFVVMPVILSSVTSACNCVAALEKHYLVNRKENLFFALLVDFKDADSKVLDDDIIIINTAIEAIYELNQKHPAKNLIFSLFYREREWNESQKCWMGWERKRGKIEAFNALLAGETNTGFLIPVGNIADFNSIKYVITLDSDTELTNDSASELIGVMEHPLNKPIFDITGNRITSGYVIIQSEVRNRVQDASSGMCQKIFSGQSNFDPYATIVSDVYQDTFEEGIYAGKGIYHLKAFHQILNKKIPENQVLSHDLLEGSFTRCAFASGIKLMNPVPSSVVTFIRREHRWIRGDWQLLPFIFGKSEINLLSRWKMLDNLRRSLIYPSQILLLVCAVFLVPNDPWIWIPFLFYDPVVRILTILLGLIRDKVRHPFSRLSFPILWQNLSSILVQTVFFFVLLPSRAYHTTDAIIRTLYRLLISRRNLLEWQTAESVEENSSKSINVYIKLMIPSIILALILVFRMFLPIHPAIMIFLLAISILWILSPLITWFSSTKTPDRNADYPTPAQTRQLRILAARIWTYFVDFSDEKHHFLCPDHLQESPGPKRENKASPTNIGMQLLSALSARDMGFIGLYSFIEYCDSVLSTVNNLPKWHGHLYNWYNTETLQVLDPHYVSTVDSGNFIAHIITLKNGLLNIMDSPVYTEALSTGLDDLQQLDSSSAKNPNPATKSSSKYKTNAISIENKLKDFSQKVDELFSNTTTGARTRNLCEEFIDDKIRFSTDDLSDLLKTPKELCQLDNSNAMELIATVERLVSHIDYLVDHIEFRPLYDSKKHLFRIGYHTTLQKSDRGHYNLMASEARITSFLAVAKGDVSKKHWLALGRPLTLYHGIPALVSWSGSMFEYLMPNLVMRVPQNSILDYSCRAAVSSQIGYGRKMHFPWGVSESQYHVFDNHANYQYGPFGVGRMRLQSSLKPVKVIAPYATLLALGTNSGKAIKNINLLYSIGAEGQYGFYESLDYNNSDPSTRKNFFLVRSFMAHHLGMSIAAINNLLNNNILQNRFHSEPLVRASESLLEDTFTSSLVTIASRGYTIDVDSKEMTRKVMESRSFSRTNTPYPIAHVLSNGHYQLLLTTQGDGFSSCDDVMINRWKPNFHDGGSGSFIYIREPETNHLWSNTYHPVMAEPDTYQAIFSHDKIEYRRSDGNISCYTEITLSPVDQLEIRRITLTNLNERVVTLELTSYIELALNDYMADLSHPAYSKLFIETKFDPDRRLLIATRRAKTPSENNGYVMHQVRTDAKLIRPISYQNSRQAFIGRGGSLMSPDCLKPEISLISDKGSASIDPVLSLQVVLTIAPGRSVSINFITGFCQTMADVITLNDKLAVKFSDDDIFKMSRTNSLLEMEYLKIQSSQLNAVQDLVGALYYPTSAFKNGEDARPRNQFGQSGLWRFGISGDLPIMLLRLKEVGDLEILKDVLLVYEFLRLQKVMTDLIILNEEDEGYASNLQQLIFENTSTIRVCDVGKCQSGIFVIRSSKISAEEKDLFTTISRIIFSPQIGIYFPKVKSAWPVQEPKHVIPLAAGKFTLSTNTFDSSRHDDPIPEFFNGIGGFVHDGREYEMRLTKGTKTPAPWINVIANEHFGFQISEVGAGYTWSGNSRENKITTWYNDPVLDPLSEAVYVQDKETGAITSPCAMVAGTHGPFYVRHGFGYSVFERRDTSLSQSLTVFVSKDKPVKLSILKLRNKTSEPMDLTLSYFVEWVLGTLPENTNRFVISDFNSETQLLTARNVYSDSYRDQVAFLFSSEPVTSFTGDRKAFIGEGGTVQFPYGLSLPSIPENVSSGYDSCGVIQCNIHIEANSSKTVVFGMGQTKPLREAVTLSTQFRDFNNAELELKIVKEFWNRIPGDVNVKTPDRAMDIMMNGWLIYQVISCRLRAKAAFYQCGGAFGFRDQLQDVLSVMDFDPEMTRSHILKCCSRQFVEGDVQHWWHESNGIGVRTKISDNLLWLPYVTSKYCKHTGNFKLLDEQISFLQENILAKNQSELVSNPRKTDKTASLYDHCILAIDFACRFGVHGLPLMKNGDWNDGMNLVGPDEKGESVWLGWFLYSVLQAFIPICRSRKDDVRAIDYENISFTLLENIEKNAWDGEWYLRAFFDNGNPIGSAQNEDCQIDSISQSWALISKGANKNRSEIALHSAQRYLVKPEDGLVLLLTPPFDKGSNHPGYIKGYNPGIRENGGQYTHAAVWLAMAFCENGDGNEAYRILNMINPIQATSDFRSVSRYEREPYVMSADVSSGFPNTGKGGWSWYTGAAGWMYQTILRSFLGVRKEGSTLVFEPCIPSNYRRYQVEYQFGDSLYEITVLNDNCSGCTVKSLSIDGIIHEGNRIEMIDDKSVHHIEIQLVLA